MDVLPVVLAPCLWSSWLSVGLVHGIAAGELHVWRSLQIRSGRLAAWQLQIRPAAAAEHSRYAKPLASCYTKRLADFAKWPSLSAAIGRREPGIGSGVARAGCQGPGGRSNTFYCYRYLPKKSGYNVPKSSFR